MIDSGTTTPDTHLTDASITTGDAPADMFVPRGFVRRLDITDVLVAGGPHTDFPLLVSTTQAWLMHTTSGGDVAHLQGFDVWFSLDQAGTMRLSHESELYNPMTGGFVAWVKIPSLTASTALYIHYGDPAIATSQENVADVWSNNYRMVYHLDGGGDSTATTTAVGTAFVVQGRVAEGREFDGTQSINIGSPAGIDNVFAAGGTAEAWFNAQTFGGGSFGRIFDKSGTGGWSLFVDNVNQTNTLDFLHDSSGGSLLRGQWRVFANTITLNTWHHVAVTYNKASNANDPVIYIDGVVAGIVEEGAPGGTISSDADSALYTGNSPAGDRAFDGALDELRLSATIRTAGWIATQHANMVNPGAFLTFGSAL